MNDKRLGIWLTDAKGRRVGSLELDADAVASAYADYHANEFGWGTPPDAKATGALLPSILGWLSDRIVMDLPTSVSIALGNAEDAPLATGEDVKALAKARQRLSVSLSRMRLDALFDLPVSNLLPDRPTLRMERSAVDGQELSFGDYLVGALLEDDGTAWKAIQTVLRPKLKPGRKRKISSDDLDLVDATARDIKDVRQAIKDGRTPNAEIRSRLKNAGYSGTIKLSAPKKLAIALVAKETGHSKKTLDQRARNRRRTPRG